ncbi:MAG: VWA domain-containing protein [Rhodospirillaceae bacterium]|jgi:hypothetical protein|nr:VWA domain-containing protein [Rhodospirillaceae bacterium]
MAKRDSNLPSKAGGSEVQEFLDKLARTPAVHSSTGRGRLLFAMDATASREPSWDRACHIQGEMFQATDGLGGLEVQLIYFRGYGECKATKWMDKSGKLVRAMTSVRCLGGRTQIGRVLKHAISETKKRKVNAMVLVGDCMEEDVDDLCASAGELGVLGVPVFVFQEGDEPAATLAFRQFATLTGGAHCRFDSSSASQLKDLLAAVAVFAAGGRKALADFSRRTGGATAQITSQLG